VLHLVLRRAVHAIPVLLGVSVLVFLLAHIAPGDPASLLVPVEAPQAVIDRVRAAYGFDQPLPVQYGMWLQRLAVGDLGTSVVTGLPVAEELFDALGKTVLIALPAAICAFVLGSLLGLVAAFRAGGWLDRLCSSVAILGISVPPYWTGILLVVLFSVWLGWLPAAGLGAEPVWTPEGARHLILPVVTMTLIPMGFVARLTRAAALEVLSQDFVDVLRAKGLGGFRIGRHVLRNALPAALAVMGLQFAYMLGGSILVETVFNWPGAGLLLNNAILRRDIPVLQAAVLVLAAIFVLVNLAVDLLNGAADPRLRRA
jgi:peptide/nickel transport system permease protein